jgi:hypothetical protein
LNVESSTERFHRILSALEALVEQETAVLLLQDFEAAMELQARTAPLVEFIASCPRELRDPSFRERTSLLFQRREQNVEFISRMMAENRRDLRAVEGAQRRALQVAPAYVNPQAAPGQLSFVV